MIHLNRAFSVSYTHLDVYKRQLQDMCRKKGATVVIVTHNGAIAPIADRVIHMHDATVKKIEIDKHPRNISEIEW